MLLPDFWSGKRVLLTGHTGFKGAWCGQLLSQMGAHVHGLALDPETEPSMHLILGTGHLAGHRIIDIGDARATAVAVREAEPQIVIHMAAQALVRRSYRDPVGTMRTNVMGTVHLLDALRTSPNLQCVLVVTSDKVYDNADEGLRFTEQHKLGGTDPYSASKAAAEIVTASLAKSFFDERRVPVVTARAGNVIGGGDWSEDRLIPDIWRAMKNNKPLELRYPNSTRPWQHVLEPIGGYMTFVERLCRGDAGKLPHTLNFGPREVRLATVAEIAEAIGKALGSTVGWRLAEGQHPPEKAMLSIDARLAADTIGWQPVLTAAETIQWTVDWYKAHAVNPESVRVVTLDQINIYCSRLS